MIYTHSLYNINTLENIFTVNGDIRVTPSYSNGTEKCYGSGTLVELLNGDNVAFSQTIVVYGDVNGDAVIDVLDVAEIEKVSNANSVLEGYYKTSADINSSGKIDILDYQAAVNKALS